MGVDQKLFETAAALLDTRFPDGPGMATAAYTDGGRLLTGVRVDAIADPACLCPETGPICEVAKSGEKIVAILSVARNGPGHRLVVDKPCGLCMERLVFHVSPTAEVAVHDRYGKQGYQVRSYQELIHPHPGIPHLDDRHRTGMREIAEPLRQLADGDGANLVENEFERLFSSALTAPEGVTEWGRPSEQPRSPYSRWTTLSSTALRQVGWAFEKTTSDLVDLFVEAHEEELRGAGCDEHDLAHVKAGTLGFLNVFSNLLHYLESGEPADFELPFEPYTPTLLSRGKPLDEFVSRRLEGKTGAVSDRELVEELARILRLRAAGGFVPYLRQRGLFSLPLFDEGTRHCPFARFSEKVCCELAAALSHALERGLVRCDELSSPTAD